jgi:hypothetical protein
MEFKIMLATVRKHKYFSGVLWSIACLCILRGVEYLISYLGANTSEMPALSLVLAIAYLLLFTLLIVFILAFLYNKLSAVSLFRGNATASNLMLLAFSVFFVVIEAELALQLFYEPPRIVSGWKVCRTESCWTDPRVQVQVNQLGYRGQPIRYNEDDYVVVLLGDSFVEAAALGYWQMPERLLQYYLNLYSDVPRRIRVFTVGCGGYGQDQQLLALKEYYRTYRADLVVLWQILGNDIWNNIFPTHWPTNGTPKPTYWLEDGELYGPSERHIGDSLVPHIHLLALWKNYFYNTRRDDIWEMKYLRDYRPYTPLDQYQGPVKYDWQKRWDQNIGSMRYENLKIGKSHLAISLTPRSPRMLYGLELTRGLLHKIEQLVKDHGGRFIIFNDDVPMGNKSWESSTYKEEVHFLNGKYYKTSKKQYYENLDYVNEGFESYTIQLTLKNWAVSPTDSHLNMRANDQVLRDLAHKLQPEISGPAIQEEEQSG